MIGCVAQRLMDMEVEGVTGAAYGEKNPDRLAERNGYAIAPGSAHRDGRVAHPELCQRLIFPSFLEPRRIAEKTPTAVVQEGHAHGVSIRAVDDLEALSIAQSPTT
jgi:putative transposase